MGKPPYWQHPFCIYTIPQFCTFVNSLKSNVAAANLPPCTLCICIYNNQCKKRMSFRPWASAEWRNPPRWIKNHHKIKPVTREDSSTRFTRSEWHVDRWYHTTTQVVFVTLSWRWIIAATLRSSIHPHGLYSRRPRNGTQAVPYGFADTSVF